MAAHSTEDFIHMLGGLVEVVKVEQLYKVPGVLFEERFLVYSWDHEGEPQSRDELVEYRRLYAANSAETGKWMQYLGVGKWIQECPSQERLYEELVTLRDD